MGFLLELIAELAYPMLLKRTPSSQTILRRRRRSLLGSIGSNNPHGEELRTTAIGVAECLSRPFNLVVSRKSADLQCRFQEAQHS